MIYVRKLLLLLPLVLTGCSLLGEQPATEAVTTEAGRELITEVSTEHITIFEDRAQIVYSTEEFPIIKDGVILGWGKVNFVEKLGIWDWYNKQAVQNGVHNSYAINLEIDMGNYFIGNDELSIECCPYLETADGVVVGEPCYVGWSGFSSIAELYNKNTKSIIEVNLQPYNQQLNPGDRLRLDFQTADGKVQFDPVYVDGVILQQATDGAQILTIDDKKEIESINGARYTISIKDVYRELHAVKKDPVYKNGNYMFYDFTYQIKYNSGPTNDREVLTFDSFNKNAIAVPLKIKVCADTDSTVLNDNVYSALRQIYSDSNKTELYCFPFESTIAIGDKLKVNSNRMIPDSTNTDAKYLRLIVEFPEEQAARNDEETKSFNGRYTVWQVPFSIREMEEKP